MIKDYAKYTTYKDVEDLKRLDFIINSVRALNNPNAKILDIGCGNGNMSLALGSLGYFVTGIDIDKTSIEHATILNTFKNVKFEVNDANSLAVKDAFDVVVCSEVLEHLKQPRELTESIYRILKPGGVFIATVPNGYGPREVLITRPMQWLHQKGWDKQIVAFKKLLGYDAKTMQSSNEDLLHIHFFSLTAFMRLMHDIGFVNIDFSNADFLERIFPFSFFTRRIKLLQSFDCWIANYLPRQLTCGFYTSWTKVVK
ncbi:MAG: methyltransferase domain-containing protein [Bacteroidia bacterium]|nr:methyltransferase domain-containing protein [Bacteroidia bacterium]